MKYKTLIKEGGDTERKKIKMQMIILNNMEVIS